MKCREYLPELLGIVEKSPSPLYKKFVVLISTLGCFALLLGCREPAADAQFVASKQEQLAPSEPQAHALPAQDDASSPAPPARLPLSERPQLELKRGQPSIEGALGAQDVEHTLRFQQAKLQRCALNSLVASPELAGELRVQLDLAADGSVSQVSLTGELAPTAMGECFRTLASTWRFPAKSQGSKLELPYRVETRPAGPVRVGDQND